MVIRPSRRGAVATFATAALAAALAVSAPLSASAATDFDLDGTADAARNGAGADRADAVRASIVDGPAKNVILLIGDGMGDSEITAARNYLVGAGGSLPGIDALPLTGQYTTYSLYPEGNPNVGKVDAVPDSAATGTAWATGTKTYDNAVGVDIYGDREDNLIEIAKANGLRTGNVSTAEIQDATPAVQAAHVAQRACYGPDTDAQRAAAGQSAACGPDAKENGGAGSISEQLLDTRADVTFGGGREYFSQTANAGVYSGLTLEQQAADRGYQYVTTAAGLDGITEADQESPVLGLFAERNFATRFSPSVPVQGVATGTQPTIPAIRCTDNPAYGGDQPALAALTEKSIDLLDRPDGESGFFLQVEGASIDKQDHAADACGQIGETQDLDEAVQAALEFAEADGETLVIVTADHAHTSQIVDNVTPGLNTRLTTADGTSMLIAYGTAAAGGSQQHTGAQLRIAAYGPGAANVLGLTDQTDNFFTMANALELDRDLVAASTGATATADPTEVAPGGRVTITGSGFAGDVIVNATFDGEPLGQADVIDGVATFVVPVDADAGEGDYEVVLTGARTGVTATATFTVAVDADASSGDGTDDGAPAPGAGGGANGGTTPAGSIGGSPNAGGSLSFTGAEVAPFLALGGLLLAAGTALVVRARMRRARHA